MQGRYSGSVSYKEKEKKQNKPTKPTKRSQNEPTHKSKNQIGPCLINKTGDTMIQNRAWTEIERGSCDFFRKQRWWILYEAADCCGSVSMDALYEVILRVQFGLHHSKTKFTLKIQMLLCCISWWVLLCSPLMSDLNNEPTFLKENPSRWIYPSNDAKVFLIWVTLFSEAGW